MDIKITNSSLRKFIETPADIDTLAGNVSLCGPTFDRVHNVEDDYIFEIESITNRVDTASAQGVAREAATILTQFGIPAKMINDPYKDTDIPRTDLPTHFHIDISTRELVVRFTAISLTNIQIKESPEETRKLLDNCSERPINNAVDITNELTILYGMPSHVFDLDKLGAHDLKIRESRKDEEITTLNNNKNTLKGGDIVIEDSTGRLVDLCGVMGGQIAEVDEHTKNILLIVPVYNPKKVRTTSLYLQNRTLAAQLYEKQPDPELCTPVINKAIQLFKERANAKISSPLFDFYPNPIKPKTINLDLNWLDRFIGYSIPEAQVVSILSGLGFSGTPIEKRSLNCVVPSFRHHDIDIKEDLAEEIARIYGYFRLPSILPLTAIAPETQNNVLVTENIIRLFLSNIGYHEIYNNSLISLDLITKSELEPGAHIKLLNALSSDFELLRTSLAPSLLQNLRNNQGKIEGLIRMFEVANIYIKQDGQELPMEESNMCLLSTGSYLQSKGDLEAVVKQLNCRKVTFKTGENHKLYHSSHFATVESEDGVILGAIGQVKPRILRNFGITSPVIVSEINLALLSKTVSPGYTYRPVSEYPAIVESLTLETNKPIGDIIEELYSIEALIVDVKYTSSFKNKHTFRITFGSNDRNLTQKEVNDIKDKIIHTVSS